MIKEAILNAMRMLLLLGLLSPSASADMCAQLRVNGGNNWFPFFLRGLDNQNGIVGDIIFVASKRANVPLVLTHAAPWKRVLYDLDKGNIDIIAGALKTKEREKIFDFSAPVSQLQLHVFVRRSHTFPFSSPDDLIGKTGVKLRGTSLGDALDLFALEELVIEEASNSDSLFKMLAAGRVDYAIAYGYHGLQFLENNGLSTQLAMLPMPLATVDLYIAFSKASKCSSHIKRLTEEIQKMTMDGSSQAIIEQYAQQMKTRFTEGHGG